MCSVHPQDTWDWTDVKYSNGRNKRPPDARIEQSQDWQDPSLNNVNGYMSHRMSLSQSEWLLRLWDAALGLATGNGRKERDLMVPVLCEYSPIAIGNVLEAQSGWRPSRVCEQNRTERDG